MPKTNAPTAPTPAAATTNRDSGKSGTVNPGGELGKDAFLKLLVAQLKYQDPMSPMDNTQFLAQTAQFTTVEKLTDVATVQQSLLTAQLQLGASNLIGKTVSYTDKDGKVQTGVVTAAKFDGTTPSLHVGDADIAIGDVKEITAGGTPAPQAGQNAQNGTATAGHTAPPTQSGQAASPTQSGQTAPPAQSQNQPQNGSAATGPGATAPTSPGQAPIHNQNAPSNPAALVS